MIRIANLLTLANLPEEEDAYSNLPLISVYPSL
jgi:hypothetical protein